MTSLDFGFDPALFASAFALVFVAELPDKTAFASLLLGARGNAPFVFLGVAAAFVVQTLIAISVGSLLILVPRVVVRTASGLLFLLFAWLMWRRREVEGEEEKVARQALGGPWRTMAASFAVIFVAEWGDLTQLATATLEARDHSPTTLFLAATLALWSVAALAVFVGHRVLRLIDPQWVQRIAVAAFAIVGLLMLAGVLG